MAQDEDFIVVPIDTSVEKPASSLLMTTVGEGEGSGGNPGGEAPSEPSSGGDTGEKSGGAD